MAEFAAVLATYRVTSVSGDRYGGEWPRERFRAHGMAYTLAERTKSDLYRELLPLVNSGAVELLDQSRLIAQFCGLERRTARGGRESIDHAPSGRDDVANAAAGALLAARAAAPRLQIYACDPQTSRATAGLSQETLFLRGHIR